MNEKYFLGYPLFNKTRNPNLQAYNRANIYMNIKERHGSVPAERYVQKLDRNGMVAVYKIMARCARDGYEQVRRDVMRGHNA